MFLNCSFYVRWMKAAPLKFFEQISKKIGHVPFLSKSVKVFDPSVLKQFTPLKTNKTISSLS